MARDINLQELMHRLQAITAQAPCVLFMEGSTSAPAEGGSSQAVALLKKAGLQFQHFDVTTDSALRQQLIQHLADKAACNYPLLFVNGEFVGGIDEIKKLDDQGQLAHLSAPGNLTLRLQKLINKAPVMVFMKGSPDTPRCGFSRTLMDIFKKHKVTFDSFDILTDEDVRQGLKQYSNWPTYPQVYVKGTLIGGLDIIKRTEVLTNFPVKTLIQTYNGSCSGKKPFTSCLGGWYRKIPAGSCNQDWVKVAALAFPPHKGLFGPGKKGGLQVPSNLIRDWTA
ncbi:hypothetical protein HPB49_014464 [Dermacentor silvarum]|uniref:Uncharacterized protein n=1 Tax=Dermacentor silvarum TaxID=543639 RepID=A0ACB8E102_DERSI|nr:hypothetical protein HPB49_014464 [Dermacentor silvarum]